MTPTTIHSQSENFPWLLYGANGYTGEMIAHAAYDREICPIVAGRSEASVQMCAVALECKSRIFELRSISEIVKNIKDCRLVLNCAGPFSTTARPMMEACLQAGVHYLDITGEIDVIEAAAAMDEQAKQAGVVLLPAVGFDVVATDCLAAMLAARLPDASRLLLAIKGASGMSPGTAKTVVEALPHGGRARVDGKIERVPLAWKVREIAFREGEFQAMTIPWGDVASAFYSTGIPNIETYAAVPPKQIRWIKRLRWLTPLAAKDWIQNKLRQRVEHKIAGPTKEQRKQERSSVWGRVENENGEAIEATLTAPNGYDFTVASSLAAVERLAASPPTPGFATPSKAFGADFVSQLPEVDIQFS